MWIFWIQQNCSSASVRATNLNSVPLNVSKHLTKTQSLLCWWMKTLSLINIVDLLTMTSISTKWQIRVKSRYRPPTCNTCVVDTTEILRLFLLHLKVKLFYGNQEQRNTTISVIPTNYLWWKFQAGKMSKDTFQRNGKTFCLNLTTQKKCEIFLNNHFIQINRQISITLLSKTVYLHFVYTLRYHSDESIPLPVDQPFYSQPSI